MPRSSTIKTTASHRGRPREFDREKALLRALDVFWKSGYEPASVSQLCAAMEINPPSLYAAFGNKAQLFLEAANYYERVFWEGIWAEVDTVPDVKQAIVGYFMSAAKILTSTTAPCGCLVVLAATNVSAESQSVIDALKQLRHNSQKRFKKRLSRAMKDGQLPAGTDIATLASTLHALIEGMSIQARDGASQTKLEKIANTVAVFFTYKVQLA